jgi:hypothetical protein
VLVAPFQVIPLPSEDSGGIPRLLPLDTFVSEADNGGLALR